MKVNWLEALRQLDEAIEAMEEDMSDLEQFKEQARKEREALKAHRWNVGDVVRLNSGGPEMTISEVVDFEWIECCWFNGTDYETLAFRRDQLNLVEPSPEADGSPASDDAPEV